MFSSR